MSESEFSSELIRAMLYKSIQNDIKSENFNVKVESASKAETDKFAYNVYRIFFERGNEDETGNSSLILKIASQNILSRTQFHSRSYFLGEIYMYDKILPNFRTFEQSKGLFIEDGVFTEYPTCYGTFNVEPIESLQLEDMNIREFTSINRNTEQLTIDHIRLYLQAIAKFHAISLALKDQHPEMFKYLTSDLHKIHIERNIGALQKMHTQQLESVLSLFSADEDIKLLEKLKYVLGKEGQDNYIDGMELESNEPATVFSYGNANVNNTMFKYDSNRKPMEICLVDWQASRIASPVTDIVNYVFTCATKDFRDAHYDKMLKIYHESLSTHIRRLGSDPDKLFPYGLLQQHLHKFAKYGIITAYMVLPILTSDPDSGLDLDAVADATASGEYVPSSNAFFTGKSSTEFHRRMRDVVVDMERLGYI